MPTDAVLADLIEFLRASPTPYHAVESAAVRLSGAGFVPLDPASAWSDLAPGRYHVRGREGDGAIVAFVVPASRATGAFRIVGAHTDSPNLRLKPSAEYTREGFVQLGVEVYGGALLNSWLDRDLGLAGRVVVRDRNGRLETRLVRFDRPLARVAQLAIHLDRDVNDKGLVLNKQEHLAPIFALASKDRTNPLASLVAAELDVAPAAIVSSELMLHDVTPPVIGGAHGEFLFSARLDNLAMCHAGVTALTRSAPRADERDVVPMVVLFDHEEVGSGSAYGAESPLLGTVIERIVDGTGGSREAYHRALARSLCVSADMAHALHPNYVERHEARHRVALDGGPTVKFNAQQRYATCARTAALFQDLCRREEIPVQQYAHRTDLPCGSTIGPITSSRLGIRTVDVGNPMIGMHSIREMTGTRDPERMTRALAAFFTSDDVA